MPQWDRHFGMGSKARGAIIAQVIADMAEEHGLPNRFSVGEIAAATDYRLNAIGIGRLLQDRFILPGIIDRLKARGIKYARYAKIDGRSYVELESLSA